MDLEAGEGDSLTVYANPSSAYSGNLNMNTEGVYGRGGPGYVRTDVSAGGATGFGTNMNLIYKNVDIFKAYFSDMKNFVFISGTPTKATTVLYQLGNAADMYVQIV